MPSAYLKIILSAVARYTAIRPVRSEMLGRSHATTASGPWRRAGRGRHRDDDGLLVVLTRTARVAAVRLVGPDLHRRLPAPRGAGHCALVAAAARVVAVRHPER